MSFRRSGSRDDRRRRVLNETISYRQAVAARDWSDRERPEHKSAHYGDASFLEEQPRLTDLAPRRPIAFLVLFIVGCLVIGGLLGLHYFAVQRFAHLTTDGKVEAFHLDAEGTVAVWFSSFLLLLSAVGAMLVYSIRRFRTDDYNGRYRIWVWAALCWLVMSIDETGSLHEGFKEAMSLFTGTRILGDGSMWWIMAYFFILAPVGIRLLLDMRESKLSVASFVCVAFCYVNAVAAQLGLFFPTETDAAIMIEEGLEMLGNLFLLLTMGLYLRHVLADAEGLLPHRAKDDEAEDSEEIGEFGDDVEDEDEYEIDPRREAALVEKARTIRMSAARPTASKPAPPAPQAPQALSSSPEFSSIGEAEEYYGRRLTKQEKKRIRQQIVQRKNRAG